MARILLTAGPTRAYIDEVRYLTNASSGRMARSIAQAALARGHDVTIVSTVGNGDGSESMPLVAKITAPARGKAAHDLGSCVAAHHTSRLVQPIRPISSSSQPS